jgi:hypothetical protein
VFARRSEHEEPVEEQIVFGRKQPIALHAPRQARGRRWRPP